MGETQPLADRGGIAPVRPRRGGPRHKTARPWWSLLPFVHVVGGLALWEHRPAGAAQETLHLLKRELAVAVCIHVVEDAVVRFSELVPRKAPVAVSIHEREHHPHHRAHHSLMTHHHARAHHGWTHHPRAHHPRAHHTRTSAHHLATRHHARLHSISLATHHHVPHLLHHLGRHAHHALAGLGRRRRGRLVLSLSDLCGGTFGMVRLVIFGLSQSMVGRTEQRDQCDSASKLCR
jgi:hypothetical protein